MAVIANEHKIRFIAAHEYSFVLYHLPAALPSSCKLFRNTYWHNLMPIAGRKMCAHSFSSCCKVAAGFWENKYGIIYPHMRTQSGVSAVYAYLYTHTHTHKQTYICAWWRKVKELLFKVWCTVIVFCQWDRILNQRS